MTDRLLDDTGWRILDLLQDNARIPFSALGRAVALGLNSRIVDEAASNSGCPSSSGEHLHADARARLEPLKEIVPTASRIAVLVNPDDPNAPIQIRNAEAAARTLRVQLHPLLNVRGASDLEGAFEAAVRARAAAALRMVDPTVTMLRVETAALAAKHRLPMMYAFREDVEVGGLVAYGTNLPAQFRQAATFVHKILRGAKPGDLPIEQPTKFELVINMKTAKTLGLTIPASLLLRADQVIE